MTIAACAVAVCVAVAGSAGWAVVRGHDGGPDVALGTPLSTPSQPASPSEEVAPPSTASIPPNPSPLAPPVSVEVEPPLITAPSTSPSSVSPAPRHGARMQITVESSEVDDSTTAQVQQLLGYYLGAISVHDYDQWSTTVSDATAARQPRAAWMDGYRTTIDTHVRITNLRSTGTNSATVSVSFVSTQDPDGAPLGAARLCWTQELPVVDLDGDPLIDVVAPVPTSKNAC